MMRDTTKAETSPGSKESALGVIALLLSLLIGGCGGTGNELPLAPAARPAPEDGQVLGEIEDYTLEGMERWEIPGLALGIVKHGELIYARGFGFRDPARSLEVTPKTDFGLASMTKSFTALAIGLMVQDGLAGWDEPVRKRVGDFELSDPELAARVTWRDLLSHRTGLAEKDSLWTSGEYRAEEIYHHLDEMEVEAPLGERFGYNNVLYIAAAVMVERLCGEDWETVLRKRVLGPLGMDHTGFSVDELLQEPEYSVTFTVEDGALQANDFPGPEHNAWYFTRGSGSMYSNVEDMAKWMALQLNEGRVGKAQVVDAETVAETHLESMPLGDPPFYLDYQGIEDHGYGMGWFLDRYRGHRRIHHGGTSLGYSNYVTLFPDDDLGIVVLSNRAVLFPVELMYYAGDLLLGLEAQDWEARFAEYNPSAPAPPGAGST